MSILTPRRVCVTGLGIITPIGIGLQETWHALMNGISGISLLHPSDLSVLHDDPSLQQSAWDQLRSHVVARIPRDRLAASPHYHPPDARRHPPFISYALTAASEALSDAKWHPPRDSTASSRTGVFIGVGMGHPADMTEAARLALSHRLRRLSPYLVPRILPNMAAGLVSMQFGLTGPNHAVSTACASGAHAIGDAYRAVQRGDADVAVAGASEASIDPISLGGFSSLRALSSKYNDAPERASRPFDKGRDGFVLGEGAAVLILEAMDHALARREAAKRLGHPPVMIYGEVCGYGMSSDAHHVTQPAPGGAGAVRAMEAAFAGSGTGPILDTAASSGSSSSKRVAPVVKLDKSHVRYVNAHATSTPQGDDVEQQAIATVFGERATHSSSPNPLFVSSTKGATGHLLGAAGAAEAVFTLLSLQHGTAPCTLNLTDPDPFLLRHLIMHRPQSIIPIESNHDGEQVIAAMSNSFGFGGTNVSLLFRKWPQID